MDFIEHAAIFFGAAIVAVSLARRLGLGSVLGYLVAGVVLGPDVIGAFFKPEVLLQYAEIGVVLLLFVVGLELSPKRLWTLRRAVFGVGAAQVALTGLALFAIALLLGQPPILAALIGIALALSSTALGLQTLSERGDIATPYGRTGFGILLFQDLAVMPVLVFIPLLAGGGDGFSLMAVGKAGLIIALVLFGGRYILQFLLRLVARTGVRELMTAAALLIVAATAVLMEFAGLSMELGAFLAGVLLAESEFRHELEANIEPFKGLLLGLFFFAIGMSIDLDVLTGTPGLVLSLVVALIVIKFLLLVLIARFSGLKTEQALKVAALLAQGGEFAFVVLAIATQGALFDTATTTLLVLVVALSMAATPLLVLALDKICAVLFAQKEEPDYETPPPGGDVVIAGYGRFGQIISRILRARGIPFTALEKRQAQVDFVKNYGSRVHYGDASRLELLRAAEVGKARAFILAVDDPEASLKIARVVHKHFPEVPVYARARDRKHAYQLMDIGVHYVIRETLHSSLELTENLLRGLGFDHNEAKSTVQTFLEHDQARLERDLEHHSDYDRLFYLAKQGAEELKDLFEREEKQRKRKMAKGEKS